MKLVFLPANNAWVFLFGDAITRMGSAPLFFARRSDAVFEARAMGLRVSRSGKLEVL